MLSDLDLDQTQSLIRGIRIPVRPAVVQKLMQMEQQGDIRLKAVAELVSEDVALSAAVLKTINSPLFGFGKQVSSIQKAVTFLGFKNISNIVVSISLRTSMTTQNNSIIERFWDSATDVALVAAGIAHYVSDVAPDEAYTLGLFRDCGMPLLMMKHDDYVDTVQLAYADPETVFTIIEDEAYQTNHSTVGYFIAKSWCIPDHICRCILNHHEHDLVLSNNDKQNDLLAILKLSEAISHRYQRSSDYPEWTQIGDEVLDCLKLTYQEFSEIKDDMSERLAHAA